MQVIWKTLYGQSSGDHGTLGYFRSLLNHNTVNADTKKAVDANLEFLSTVVKGHLLACAFAGSLESPISTQSCNFLLASTIKMHYNNCHMFVVYQTKLWRNAPSLIFVALYLRWQSVQLRQGTLPLWLTCAWVPECLCWGRQQTCFPLLPVYTSASQSVRQNKVQSWSTETTDAGQSLPLSTTRPPGHVESVCKQTPGEA